MKGQIWLVGTLLVAALMMTARSPGGQQGGGQQDGAGGAGKVAVSEKEWVITFPSSSIRAGKVTFVVKNEGAIEHNFVIENAGVEVDAIQPGQSKEVTVDLKPGTFNVVCNIPGHAEAGMKTTLTVTQ